MTTTKHTEGSRSYLIGDRPAGTLAEALELARTYPDDELAVLVDGQLQQELTDLLLLNI